MAHVYIIFGLDFGTRETKVSWAISTQDGQNGTQLLDRPVIGGQKLGMGSISMVSGWWKADVSQSLGLDPIEFGCEAALMPDERRQYYDFVSCFKNGIYECDETLELLNLRCPPTPSQKTRLHESNVKALESIRQLEDEQVRRSELAALADPNVEKVWVVGTPAVWGQPEQEELLRCAESAGLKNVWLASEPEAMARDYFRYSTELQAGYYTSFSPELL